MCRKFEHVKLFWALYIEHTCTVVALVSCINLLQERFGSLSAMDGRTQLQVQSFESPKIRLLRSLSIEGSDGMQVSIMLETWSLSCKNVVLLAIHDQQTYPMACKTSCLLGLTEILLECGLWYFIYTFMSCFRFHCIYARKLWFFVMSFQFKFSCSLLGSCEWLT